MFSYIMLGTNDLPRAIRFLRSFDGDAGAAAKRPKRSRRIVGDIQRKQHHRAVRWPTV